MDPRVIVITGASSGMGRAAALRFALRGDRLLLSARRGDVLEDVVRECRLAGAEAFAVPADVTVPEQVQEVAQSALAHFGRIDAWVHTAAVASFGRLWDHPYDAMRRLADVVLVGSMFVAKVATLEFIRQGRGTLVLVSSTLGKTPIPYLGVYDAAKHGVVGLAKSLRAELRDEGLADRIRVVNVMPPSTDTPFYTHAANYVGKAPRPPPPAYSVDTLAAALVEAVDDPSQDEVTVGAMGKLMRLTHGLAPGLYEAATGPYSKTMFFDRPAPMGHGSLFEPVPEGTTPEGPLGKRKEV
ncbi:MAG TPA: SDR family NAD(P)-dependent oxidoreductase [Candidatus Thermoplasmatota archaeon]|nr:SDR family NAD(P)-dependent oxidoreductase [Candidatus Thermoplasmatota archaeon]